MQHSATMARGTAKVMEKLTTTSSPTSTQCTKKMISKGTTVTKTAVIRKEKNQSNLTSTLQTKETASSTTIAKVTTTTKVSKVIVTYIDKNRHIQLRPQQKESNKNYSNGKRNNNEKIKHSNSNE